MSGKHARSSGKHARSAKRVRSYPKIRATPAVTASALVPAVVFGGWFATRPESHSSEISRTGTLLAPAPTTPAPRLPPVVPTKAVAALKKPVDPTVFIRTTAPVTDAQLKTLLTRTGGKALLISTGAVSLGTGSAVAVGVDPSTFRASTPSVTAGSTPLWESVARGDIAVAHTVARALAVDLGERTEVGAGSQDSYDFRVGALATTGLPGVGVVVDDAYNSVLDLVPRTGLIISAATADSVSVATAAQEVFDQGSVDVAPLVTSHADQSPWVFPADGPVTSPFGPREQPLPGASSFHEGIDIGAPFASTIWAASAGVVSYAGPASGFGNEVIISHPDGVQTVYGHMEKILVSSGATVRAGDPIALVGSEGESTGAHLHFEVHIKDSPIDPLLWLTEHGAARH